MTTNIKRISAIEILDSRGFPTLRTWVELEDGTIGAASVPSGASTGENEAIELRDGDEARYGGKGVLKAVANVCGPIASIAVGRDATDQRGLDLAMIALDGTPNKASLGANAILSVSMAAAVAAARSKGLPLYQYLKGDAPLRLPMPMMNILNGGKHADNGIDFQEFMVVPVVAPSFSEALRYGATVFHTLKGLLHEKGFVTSVGDEGGFAPALKSNEQACELIVEAIEASGLRPGEDVAIALDPAANSFFTNGVYDLTGSGGNLFSTQDMVALYRSWAALFPIVSIEDGFAETDWEGFRLQMDDMGDHMQIVGDDLYVTNTRFIEEGIAKKATNAVLIKLNQIGTVTETIDAVELCRKAGWNYVVSHRSGETEDTFLADFTVAMGGGQIKTGSASRSERVAKYNRLLEIEHELGDAADFPKGLPHA